MSCDGFFIAGLEVQQAHLVRKVHSDRTYPPRELALRARVAG